MRPNMNIDVTSQEVRDNATKAFDGKAAFSPKQIVTIKEAYITYTDSGSSWLHLEVENEAGTTYRFPAQCLTAGEEKQFEKQNAFNVLGNLLIIAKASGVVNERNVNVYDIELADMTVQSLDSYTDLIGKKVGCVIRFYKKYPESKGIDGYTNRPIPDRLSDRESYDKIRKLPSTIWMPNYDKEPQFVFEPKLWFDVSTGKTLKELQDDNCLHAKEVDSLLEKMAKYTSDAIILSAVDWDKLRTKKLKAKLKSTGGKFERSRFIAQTSEFTSKDANDSTDDSDINYDDIM